MKKFNIQGWVILLLVLFAACNSEEVKQLESEAKENSNKITAIDQQIVKINESLAQLQQADKDLGELISSLKEEDSAIKRSLESTKKALEDKIAELKAYVDDELKNTKNWVSATFATLEQYQSLCDEVASLKSLLESLDISSIDEAIDSLEESMKTWVNTQLANYYTIAEMNAKLETLQNAITNGDSANAEEIATLRQNLDTAKSELTSAYQAAIEAAINQNNGVINQKIADDIKAATDAMQDKLDSLSARIDAFENRLTALEEKVAKIISGVQSVVVVPDYSDGSVRLSNIADNKIRFEVYPLEAAAAIAKTGVSILSMDYVETQTKSSEDFVNLPITAVVFSGKTLTLTVDGTRIPETIAFGTSSANARLRISDGTNTRSSKFFPTYRTRIAITGEAEVYEASVVLYGWCNQDGVNGDSVKYGFEYSSGDLSNNPETVFSNIRDSDNRYSCRVSGLNHNTLYYYRAITLYNGTIIYGEVKSFATPEFEAVDLGLRVKWASMNVGASTPEEYGDYFAWGAIKPNYISQDPLIWRYTYTGYDWSSYRWCSGSSNSLTKYNTNADFGIVDNKTVLELTDDAAHANWGDSWRMPTDEDWTELLKQCTWVWTVQNGVNGRMVTGPNGNSIFLPAAGRWSETYFSGAGYSGLYWSSSLYTKTPRGAGSVTFREDRLDSRPGPYNRCFGYSVRPVYLTANAFSASVTTLDASNITPFTSTLNGHLDSSSELSKSAWFLYSDSASTLEDLKANGSKISSSLTDNGLFTSPLSALRPNTKYYFVAVSRIWDKEFYGEVKSFTTPELEAVDLGLSIKWANMNVGASSPEEFGDYFAWGEIEPYYSCQDPLKWKDGKSAGYDWTSYRWCSGSMGSLTKYNTNPNFGVVDAKTVLEPADDAAHVKVGGNWRMPTHEEWTELVEQCTWEETILNGKSGRLVTGPNGNSIFLPHAGSWSGKYLNYTYSFGFYWSSTLYTGDSGHPTAYTFEAWCVEFISDHLLSGHLSRSLGFSVRPVSE